MKTLFRILLKRDFWPLFGAQALGAFNDNFFRQALIAFLAFGAVGLSPEEKTNMASLATGLMMLPFFLFSSLAGELADRFRKSGLVKITKIAEAGVMLLAAFFFATGQIYALLIILFFMGLQSTFFGPLKYGLLPEILDEKELLGGNGLVEAATFIAIVLGSLAGSWLATREAGLSLYMPAGVSAAALLGLAFALRQPPSQPGRPEIKVQARLWRSTYEIIASVKSRRTVWLIIMGISWFWALGAILITQIPILCQTALGATPSVSSFLVTMFALGVAIGSMAAQALLKGRVSVRLVPASAALLALFLAKMAFDILRLPPATPESIDLAAFLGDWTYLRLGLSCLLVSITGGLFVVPLNALLQHLSGETERARVIAANNILNSLFICLGSLAVILLTYVGAGLSFIFALTAVTALFVAFATLSFMPGEALKSALRLLLRLYYRPQITGLDILAAEGPALLAVNHLSSLDAVLLAAFLPRPLTLALSSSQARLWNRAPLNNLWRVLPLDPDQPRQIQEILAALDHGETVAVFPEGRPTATGSLMKVGRQAGLVAARSPAPLLPVIIDGTQYSRFGLLRKTLRRGRARTPVKLTILPSCRLEVPPRDGESQRETQRRAGEALYDLMVRSRFAAEDYRQNLWTALKAAARRHGPGRLIMEDAERRPLSYRGLLRRARILGRRLAAQSRPGEKIALLLPNSNAATAVLFGLWAGGRTAMILNHTQGQAALADGLTAAQVKTVITSRRFLAAAELTEKAAGLPARLVYLDDWNFGFRDRLAALTWRGRPAPPESPAVMVFTSGSEGRPKGAVLSHANILADILAAKSQIEINEDDTLFSAMPIFHAFGLTIGSILPLVLGLDSFNYPNPLHAHLIPELIYDARATVVIASDTFAAAWGKNAHPYDFNAVRFFLVGAEKIKDRTRKLFAQKFGLRLYEGYGVTEAGPVLAVNGPMRNREGSVGPLLPGLTARLEQVEGLAEGGRLLVKGPNIMLGYLDPARPGELAAPENGWYDTGDVAEIDAEGFVWLKGRLKRFAKIGGEMVSLAAVEAVAAALWPDRPPVVTAVADERKGEKLILVSEDPAPDLEKLRRALKEAGQPELACPREFVHLPRLPLTPLGKPNLPEVLRLVRAASAADA